MLQEHFYLPDPEGGRPEDNQGIRDWDKEARLQ